MDVVKMKIIILFKAILFKYYIIAMISIIKIKSSQ